VSGYRDDEEGLRSRRDQLLAGRAAEMDRVAPAVEILVRRRGEIVHALVGMLLTVGVITFVLISRPSRVDPYPSVVVAPLVPIVALVTFAARRARRRQLTPPPPGGTMREQIDALERPLPVRAAARARDRGWRFLRLLHVSVWPFEAAAGLGLLALPFGWLETPSLLVRYSLGVALILPLVAIHAGALLGLWSRLASVPLTGLPVLLLVLWIATEVDSALGAALLAVEGLLVVGVGEHTRRRWASERAVLDST
jgi:hypothetical protein